jgi:hypothetical protein
VLHDRSRQRDMAIIGASLTARFAAATAATSGVRPSSLTAIRCVGSFRLKSWADDLAGRAPTLLVSRASWSNLASGSQDHERSPHGFCRALIPAPSRRNSSWTSAGADEPQHHRGPLISIFMGGLNYQVEHHLCPSLARPHLRKIQTLVASYCADEGVPCTQTGLWRPTGPLSAT